jgi:hypothetical protein
MHPFLKRDSLSSVSENLQKPIFIGTSGWAYRSWKPGFYPQSLPQKKFLDYYAIHLSSVEVNYTFRDCGVLVWETDIRPARRVSAHRSCRMDEKLLAAFFPCGPHCRHCDIPVRPALLGNDTETAVLLSTHDSPQ